MQTFRISGVHRRTKEISAVYIKAETEYEALKIHKFTYGNHHLLPDNWVTPYSIRTVPDCGDIQPLVVAPKCPKCYFTHWGKKCPRPLTL